MSEITRKKFEATYRECFPIASELQPNLFSFELDGGEYVEAKIHVAFTLWLAARATAEQSKPTPEPLGYVYRVISKLRPHDPMYRFAKTGERNPDPEIVKSWTKHAVYTDPQAQQRHDNVIDQCAAICQRLAAEALDNYTTEPGRTAAHGALICAMGEIRNLKAEQDAAIESLPAEPTYPDELTPELREVLGWPNFKCARFAHLMVAAGVAEIKPKAEDEQAAVLHWLIKLVLKHGDQWNEAATADINAMRDKFKSIDLQRNGDGS